MLFKLLLMSFFIGTFLDDAFNFIFFNRFGECHVTFLAIKSWARLPNHEVDFVLWFLLRLLMMVLLLALVVGLYKLLCYREEQVVKLALLLIDFIFSLLFLLCLRN